LAALTEAANARKRLVERAGAWRVVVDDVFETESSLIAYARRGAHAEVLKIVKRPGDEWHSGDVLDEFGGRGVVRALEHVGGAILMERLSPGHSLVELTLADRDAEATAVIAGVIREMTSEPSVISSSNAHPTVEDWGKGFTRYTATHDTKVSRDLVAEAQRVFETLCRSQSNRRLLHGDLQHSNVLWMSGAAIAIDRRASSVRSSMRLARRWKSSEAPFLFTAPDTIEQRIRQYSSSPTERHACSAGRLPAVLSAICHRGWRDTRSGGADYRAGRNDTAHATVVFPVGIRPDNRQTSPADEPIEARGYFVGCFAGSGTNSQRHTSPSSGSRTSPTRSKPDAPSTRADAPFSGRVCARNTRAPA
jgi:streptomycin 6-kinase